MYQYHQHITDMANPKLERLLEFIGENHDKEPLKSLIKELDEMLKQSEWFKIIPELMECDITDNETLGRLFQAIKSNKEKTEKYDKIKNHIQGMLHFHGMQPASNNTAPIQDAIISEYERMLKIMDCLE